MWECIVATVTSAPDISDTPCQVSEALSLGL
jgi:hypothetical protein